MEMEIPFTEVSIDDLQCCLFCFVWYFTPSSFQRNFTYLHKPSGLLMKKKLFFSFEQLRDLKFRVRKRLGQGYRGCKCPDICIH
jgi:hypothetical protein